MNVLDLFSGIGGFSLGLERAGMRTVAFCEIEPYCRVVLNKHWPHVPIYDDVKTLTADRLKADGISVDVICGGFPCQDISFAGRGAGLAGARSGLWREYARIIGEVRPQYVLVENVAALLSRGLAEVLADLAALGFDAEWHCIPASAVGAPHRRDRIWIVAYAMHDIRARELERGTNRSASGPSESRDAGEGQTLHWQRFWNELGPSGEAVDDTLGARRSDIRWGETVAQMVGLRAPGNSGWWDAEPDVGRVAHGIPSRMDRLRGLGNAVVPQIPELIGKAILQAAGRLAA